MARKRKTLPRDFDDLLRTAPLEDLIAVFDRCEIEATGGYGKSTAIGFVDCPDELITWLVEQGAQVDAPASNGATPLWTRASYGRAAQIPLLLSLGADPEHRTRGGQTPLHAAAGNKAPSAVQALLQAGVEVDARTDRGHTPLQVGLIGTENASIAAMAEVAVLLIDAGAEIDDSMRPVVERIGEQFEFHREAFNPDLLEKTDAGLQQLYRLFGAAEAPTREIHDGVSPIVVPEGRWQDQYNALWDLLVPSSGPALSAQGEAIRIAGRVHDEVFRNGGANWDRDYRRMLQTLVQLCGSGEPLTEAESDELEELTHQFDRGSAPDEVLNRIDELAVTWVRRNPTPISLGPVAYRR
ncbi:MAG TPA: ankyrin repeat domain-containing protein [Candidatus Avipropionibacterium avicola]|uniref:Ankyrin repeat domain-containing protein n=1 Tax=Candidatus Avipropionibacterium avicola TaxID=2840701 RepID=A0A9D1KP67_9ACTN|nr:ankyrin repeat domain-containing protein [Candidatus Avipropionibacterium avicola]